MNTLYPDQPVWRTNPFGTWFKDFPTKDGTVTATVAKTSTGRYRVTFGSTSFGTFEALKSALFFVDDAGANVVGNL